MSLPSSHDQPDVSGTAPAIGAAPGQQDPLIARRDVLRAAALGAVAMASAAFVGGCATGAPATPGRAQTSPPGGTSGPVASATARGAAPSASAPGAVASAPALGKLVGTVAEVRAAGFKPYNDPQTGAPGVLVALASGGIGSWDNRCTHAYCAVPYDPGRRLLVCPCHSAEFDPNNDAAVVKGPATQALKPLPVTVDGAGSIYR